MTIQLAATRPVTHQTKQEMVYQTLREAILDCTLRPGQRLIILDIAQQLQVSQIPVREALQMLQSEKLIEMVPHSGARVTGISRNSVVEVFALLEGLESATTRITASRLTPVHERKLAMLVAKLATALAEGDYDTWLMLDSTFHRTIAEMTGMPILREMTERALDQWERVRHYLFAGTSAGEHGATEAIAQAQEDHQAILEAMRERDEARLEALVTRHHRAALATHQARLQRLAPTVDVPRPRRAASSRRAIRHHPKAHWERPNTLVS